MTSDRDLLQRFAATHDEACFEQLVQRHIAFVHAVSLRRLRDSHSAQDATQAVFVALARKARSVADAPSLTGWLHRSACYETNNIMRAQLHRVSRESEALRRGTTTAEARPHLAAIESVLDQVLCELSSADRDAILARYFSGRSYAEIAGDQGLTENAARMRVERALGKLRDRLGRRGVTSPAAVVAEVLPACATASVPGGFALAVTKASLVGLATGAGVPAVIGFMSTAKVIAGIAVVAAAGGIWYEHLRSSELSAELALARTQSETSHRQLQAMKKEIADLKTQRESTASSSATTAAPPKAAPPAAVTMNLPLPGVTPNAPAGWMKNGSANDLYEVGTDATNAWGGMPSAYAKSIGEADKKFGGMMQTIAADAYKNQRVKMTGWVKTEDANDGGGHLWLRVDGQEVGKSLQFDNMDGRAPKGTTDWEEYSIVLDVPADSTRLAYGFFVSGKGKMWVNGLTITPVTADVPSTNMLRKPPPLPNTPVNLGFGPKT